MNVMPPPDRPAKPPADAGKIRIDQQLIADMVKSGTRVLEVGCADGALLDYLAVFKQVDGRGMEISQAGVNACVSQGLSVIQGDADVDLVVYPSDAFDYVILSRTLQAVKEPKVVLSELVRIGHRAIVSFANFGHWRSRLHLAARGRMPVTDLLSEPWHETVNIRPCTLQDFLRLTEELGLTIEQGVILGSRGRPIDVQCGGAIANLIGEQGIFTLSRG